MDIDVRGTEGLALVGKAVRRLGSDKTIVNNMTKEIKAAVPTIREAVRKNARAILPGRGGLGRWVAKASIKGNVRRSANNAGVTITGGRNSQRKRTDLKAIDAGTVRHPLFGDRGHWYPQSVQAGFFTEVMTGEAADVFRQAVVRAVDRAAGEVLGAQSS